MLNFITAVWGDDFVDLFTDVILKYHLSNNNLLYLRNKPCAFNIYTTELDFDKLRNHNNITLLSKIIPLRIIKTNFYGESHELLSKMHKQSIYELGYDSHLVFLSADTIWSDGTFKNIYNIINNNPNTKAIYSVTLRTNREEFSKDLYHNNYILDSRTLVNLAFDYLHKTTLSLMWNPNPTNMWLSHLYWKINKDLIICKCFQYHPLVIYFDKPNLDFNSTIDGDLLEKLEYDPIDYHFIQDSDEFVGFELSPKNRLIGNTENIHTRDDVINFVNKHMSKIKKYIFFDNIVYLHSENIPEDLNIDNILDMCSYIRRRI